MKRKREGEQPLGREEWGIIQIGEDEGEEDTTVRPLRESLRKRLLPQELPPGNTDGKDSDE